MTYTIVIVLITFLILCGIAASAIQQLNEKKASQKREELTRQRNVYEETEEAVAVALHMPLSQLLIAILRKRSLNALIVIFEHNSSTEIHAKIEEIKTKIKAIDVEKPAPNQDKFALPKNDKLIIKYIQALKKLRTILRSERSKGKISADVFAKEEQAIMNLQLRVNVETLYKRALEAISNNMQGSARQYLDKAIHALTNYKIKIDYTETKLKEIQATLSNLEMEIKKAKVSKEVPGKSKGSEDDIDSLFAPKKKW